MDKEKESQNSQEGALKQIKLLVLVVLVIALLAPLLSTTIAVQSINGKIAKMAVTGTEEQKVAEGVHEKELPMFFYKPMEFLVNLGDTDASHYLRATLSLGVRLTKDDIEQFEARTGGGGGGGGHGGGKKEVAEPEPVVFHTISSQEPIVRDTVISIISNYGMDDLVSTAGKNELKETIRAKLRSQLHNENLEIYFTAFTLQ